MIITPINKLIIDKFGKDTGILNITNIELIKFVLSIRGIITILAILIIYFIAIFIEDISLKESFKNSIKIYKKID